MQRGCLCELGEGPHSQRGQAAPLSMDLSPAVSWECVACRAVVLTRQSAFSAPESIQEAPQG